MIAQSRGEAERFNLLYAEYKMAPEVTKTRMYIDTLESVMSSSTKIMIDVEGGNNILYLPLDKIIEQNQGGGFAADREAATQSAPNYGNKSEARDRRERR